jgi:hypothetical protein
VAQAEKEAAAAPGASRTQAGGLTFATELLRFRPRLSTRTAKFVPIEDIDHTASSLEQQQPEEGEETCLDALDLS